jgi:hypothetical protein
VVARLYWAADDGSVAGSVVEASLSLAGLDVSASAATGGVEEAVALIASAGSSAGGSASVGGSLSFAALAPRTDPESSDRS